MSRLEQLLLFILDRAKKADIENLSKFQLLKIPYLIQIESIKYTGSPFMTSITFMRDNNGPISIDIYNSINKLFKDGYIKIENTKTKGYKYERTCHSLAKKVPKLDFSPSETIFLDSILSDILPLSQIKLKKVAYDTEPMKEITSKEKKEVIRKGEIIDFSKVTVDSDIIDSYADAI